MSARTLKNEGANLAELTANFVNILPPKKVLRLPKKTSKLG